MALQFYPDFVKAVYPDKIKGIDSALVDNLKILLDSIASNACPAPGFPTDEAVSEATTDYAELVEAGWRALYMLPSHDLEDLPEKWIDITEGSPLKNMPVSIQRKPENKAIIVTKVELHADTINGTPGAVYRLNGDSRLAIVLYANTVSTFDVPAGKRMEDAILRDTYAVAAFIDKFPFHLGWPLTTQIFQYVEDGKAKYTGFLSDLRNQHQDIIDDPQGHLYTPQHTSIYLPDISWIPQSWFADSKPAAPSTPAPEQNSDGVTTL